MALELRFGRSLYAPDAVRAAAEAFRHLGKIEVTCRESETELVLTDPDPELADVLLDEIANYALARTIAGRRGG